MRWRALGLAIALWAALAAPGSLWAQESDAGFIGRQIENALSGPGREARVSGFSGVLSGQATMDRLTLADAEGVWLTIENAVLDWNRSALLRRRLQVAELSAEEIIVARPPLPAPPGDAPMEAPSAAASGFALPELPVAINIGALSVARLTLGAPVLGEQAVFAAEGGISLQGGEGDVALALVRQDGTDDRISLDASFSNETRVLALDLEVREDAGGLIGTLAQLPGGPSLALDVQGSGPLDDYTAEIGLSTDGAQRVAGRVTLRGADDGGLRFAADIGGDLTPLVAPQYREFFGDDVQLAAEGLRGGSGSLELETLQVRARSLDLSGSFALTPEGRPQSFALNGTLADPEGGPVRLPTAAPVSLDEVRLVAAYDVSEGEAWTLDLTASGVAAEAAEIGELSLRGGGEIGAAAGPLQVTAALDYAAAGLALADADLAAAVGDRVGGTAEILWSSEAPLSLDSFSLGGADYGLTAAGRATIAERTLVLDGEAALAAEDLSRFSGLAGRPLTGTAEIALAGEGDVLGGTFDLALDLDGSGLSIGQDLADRFLEGPVALDLAARRDETGTALDRFTLDSTGVTAQASGQIGAEGRLDFDLALADLGLIREDLEGPIRITGAAAEDEAGLWDGAIDIAGAYDLTGRIAGQLGLGDAAEESDVSLDIALPDIAPLVPTLSGPIALDGTAAAQTGGLWDVALGIGAPAGAQVDVAGVVGGEAADVTLRVAVPDIAAFAPGVPGSALIEGQAVQYAAGGYSVTLDADLPYEATAQLQGRVGASRSALTYSAQVPDLSAISEAVDGPATAEGRLVQLPNGQIAITADADGPYDATAMISAFIGQGRNGERTRAEASVRVPDVAAIAPGVPGALNADVTAQQTETGAWAVTADASGPYRARMSADATLDGGDAEATARVSVPNLAPLAPILRGGASADIAASRRDGGPWSVDVDADGPFASTASVQAEMGDGPVQANLQARLPDVAPLAGRFTGPVRLDAEIAQAEAGAPLQVSADAGLPYGGTASVSGQVGGGDGRLRFEAGLPNIAPLARGFSGSFRVTGTAEERGAGWGLNVTTAGPAAARADIQGVVGSGDATRLTAAGTAPLGLLNGILAPQRLDGDVRFDLALNGAPSLSALSGTVSTTGTRLSIPAVNLAFQDIDLTAQLGGGQISLDGGASSQQGGRLGISGPIQLAPRFPGDLTLSLDGLRLEDPSLYTTTLDGRVSVSGPLTGGGGAISGRIVVGETELRIPSGGVGFGANIPSVTHIAEPADVRQTRIRAGLVNERREAREAAGEVGNVFSLDLRIDAPRRIFLRGRGLDAELGGSFTVGGTTRVPAPVGGIEVIRGRLDLLGRRLDLSEDGRLTLGGDLVPFLDLTATSDDAEDFTILIRIEGPVNEPGFTFDSTPPLPEDEILARFFFDKGLANLSPLQAAQLAASVARLTGQGGGLDLLGGVREGLGVDDLNVVTDEEGEAALQVGTYLSENIYTDVVTSTTGQSEVSINIDITDNVTVKGSADNEGETTLGIFFERDY